MSRPTWDDTFLALAATWAKRATCLRGQFGAVFVGDGQQVLASGYNGAPRGLPHCMDRAPCGCGFGEVVPVGCLMEDSHCVRTVHAEINGIIQAARTGVSLLGSRLYLTGRPCQRCALAIVQVGVVEVVYPEIQAYHTDSEDAVRETFRVGGVMLRLVQARPTDVPSSQGGMP